MNNTTSNSETGSGLMYGLGAFLLWGVFPIYWKQLGHVDAWESLAHRLLWTLPFVVLVVLYKAKWPQIKTLLSQPRQLALLLLSAIIITVNWGVYIWAVLNNYVVEASLGYFITPLLNVLLGLMFFKERLRLWQWLAIILATLAVSNQIYQLGSVPWVALSVGFSFACYGALRKASKSDTVSGLFLEVTFLVPFAAAYLLWLGFQGSLVFGNVDRLTDAYLIGCGVMTALPLLLYIAAAKRMQLAELGLLTYLAPSLQFLIGAFVYDEPLQTTQYLTFALIWIGLIVFAVEGRIHFYNNMKKAYATR